MLDLNTKLLIISTKHIQSTIAGNEPITLRFFVFKKSVPKWLIFIYHRQNQWQWLLMTMNSYSSAKIVIWAAKISLLPWKAFQFALFLGFGTKLQLLLHKTYNHYTCSIDNEIY